MSLLLNLYPNFFLCLCIGLKSDQTLENPHRREALCVQCLRQAIQLRLQPQTAYANSQGIGKNRLKRNFFIWLIKAVEVKCAQNSQKRDPQLFAVSNHCSFVFPRTPASHSNASSASKYNYRMRSSFRELRELLYYIFRIVVVKIQEFDTSLLFHESVWN